MKRFGVFLALAAVGTSAGAAEWRPTAMSGTRGTYVITFVDFGTIRRAGDEVTFWYWRVAQAPISPGYDNNNVLLTASCSQLSYAQKSANFFMGAKLLQTVGPLAQDFAPPGSVVGQTIQAACGQGQPGPVTADPYAWTKSQ